jgi:thymidylate kinase
MAVIYIVEGVAGSGKDTLVKQLVDGLHPDERCVHAFDEEAVLASWIHNQLPGIHRIRLDLASSIVERIRDELAADDGAVFVFNRFHVSYAAWRDDYGLGEIFQARHEELVSALRALPVRILLAVLDPDEVEARSRHSERRGVAWRRFLAWRTSHFGFSSPGAVFEAQQKTMRRILEQDGLPYRTVRVRHGEEMDERDLWLDE